jgi:hypothetical protein
MPRNGNPYKIYLEYNMTSKRIYPKKWANINVNDSFINYELYELYDFKNILIYTHFNFNTSLTLNSLWF